MKFNITGKSLKKEIYRNDDAHLEVVRIMSKRERINLKLGTDRNGYPYLWIESQTINGFKYLINPEILNMIISYITHGEVDDQNIEPMKLEKYNSKADFTTDMCKQLIEEGRNIKFTPLFRDRSGSISATASYQYGKLFFNMKRTDELVEYLKEKKLI